MVHFSLDTASKINSGLVPLSRTALLPEIRLPNQCILAPVWYRGGMHKNTSSLVCPWWFCSTRQEWVRLLCLCNIAFGNPVVPEEK